MKRISLIALTVLLFTVLLFAVSCGGSTPAVTTAPHTHAYTDTVVAPTCTADGYTEHVCACGHSYRDATVPAAHDIASRTVRFPTTLTAGLKKDYCTRCDYALETEIECVSVSLPGLSDLLAAMLGEGTYSFSLKDAASSITVKNNTTTYNDLGDVIGTTFTTQNAVFGITKAEITVGDSEVVGEVSLVVTSGDESYDAHIYIAGDDISGTVNGEEGEFNIADAFYEGFCEGADITREELEEYFFLYEKLSPYTAMIESLAAALAEDIPEVQFSFFDLLALIGDEIITEEETADGTRYDVLLSAAADVLAAYADKSLADILDERYGEGTGESFSDAVIALPDKTIGEIVDAAIDFAEACEVDVDAIYQLVNYLVYASTEENFDLAAEIDERYDVTLIALLAEMSGEDAEELREELDEALPILCNGTLATLAHKFSCYEEDHTDADCTLFADAVEDLRYAADYLLSEAYLVLDEDGGLVRLGASGAAFTIELQRVVDGDYVYYEGMLTADGISATVLFEISEEGFDFMVDLTDDEGTYRFRFAQSEDETILGIFDMADEEAPTILFAFYSISYEYEEGETSMVQLIFNDYEETLLIVLDNYLGAAEDPYAAITVYNYDETMEEEMNEVFSILVESTETGYVLTYSIPMLGAELIYTEEEGKLAVSFLVGEEELLNAELTYTVEENEGATVVDCRLVLGETLLTSEYDEEEGILREMLASADLSFSFGFAPAE